MRQGTTPTITFTLPIQASTITKLSIVFVQKGTIIVEKNLEDVTISTTTISVALSEEETLSFITEAPLLIQIRCAIGATRLASNIMQTTITEILKGGTL